MTADSEARGDAAVMVGAVRVRAWACLLGLLVLLGTGCQARLTLDVAVDADGAGTLSVTLAADAALRAEARSLGADPLGDLAATGGRLDSSGWRVTDVSRDDGGREVTLSVPFAGPEEFGEVAGDLAAALAAPEVVLLEGLRLEVTEEVVRVEGDAGLVPTQEVADFGLEPDEAVAVLAAQRPLVYEVTVSLAGDVLESSAPGAAGTGGEVTMPLRWEVAPGERVHLLAVAERPRSPLDGPLLPAAAGGLVALGGLLALRRARRRRARLRFARRRGGVLRRR